MLLAKLREKILYYTASDEIPLSGRLFNITVGLCMVSAIIVPMLVERFFLLAAGLPLIMAALLYLANKFNKYRQYSFAFIVIVGYIFFPLMFIFNDGIAGAHTLYLVVGAAVICLLLSGRSCFLMLTGYMAVNIGMIVFDYYDKAYELGIVEVFDTLEAQYTDNAVGIIISCMIISGVIILQKRYFYLEQQRAEEASRAKGDFLSNMSHEIRTPLNAIIGMTSIGIKTNEIERKNYSLDQIEIASHHLLGVVNNILDMSKIEAQKFELTPHPVDFHEILQKVANIISIETEKKKQNFIVDIDSHIPHALICDEQHLLQVITNLLGNAMKFTPEDGTIKLLAKLIRADTDICKIQIEVTDSGIGISEEQISRLFNSFEQAESSTSRRFGGTGLGLAISKKMIEMMGGRIWVESEIGKGAKFAFTIHLLRDKSKRESALDGGGTPDGSADGAGMFKGYRILLVEDIEINREIVMAMLEYTEIEIDCAENGIKALEILNENPERYDFIFMDVQMPEMDGFETTRQIRALGIGGDDLIPIIAMTANVFKSDIDKCRDAGMNGHIGKPIDLGEVIAALRKYLPPHGVG